MRAPRADLAVMGKILPAAEAVFRFAARRYRRTGSRAALGDAERERMREVFAHIHRTNGWGGSESASGPGSGIERTALLRDDLSRLVKELGIDTFLDAGCGDFHWMKEADFSVQRYIGVDVVPEIIARNQRLYSDATLEFRVGDITRDRLPRADLIFCRDCLVHLPLRGVFRALENFARSGATFLLTTTFTAREANPEIPLGGWRPLNLRRAPFNLPEPVRELDERCPLDRGNYTDKRLALWRLARRPRTLAIPWIPFFSRLLLGGREGDGLLHHGAIALPEPGAASAGRPRRG